jgi:hypothetical protein
MPTGLCWCKSLYNTQNLKKKNNHTLFKIHVKQVLISSGYFQYIHIHIYVYRLSISSRIEAVLVLSDMKHWGTQTHPARYATTVHTLYKKCSTATETEEYCRDMYMQTPLMFYNL